MTVYVDDMYAKFGRMKMCHMLADTDEELHAMADRIGIARKWFQCPPKASAPHYDVCTAMREKAVAAGAVEVKYISRQFSDIIKASMRRWHEQHSDAAMNERLRKWVPE